MGDSDVPTYSITFMFVLYGFQNLGRIDLELGNSAGGKPRITSVLPGSMPGGLPGLIPGFPPGCDY